MQMNNIFVELIHKLVENNVSFVICGGLAGFLYGVNRATYDLDISISFEQNNLYKLVEAARELKLKPRTPEPLENFLKEEKRKEWIEKKNALVYTLISDDTFKQIDIFLSYPKTYEQLCEKAVKMNIHGKEVLVSSIDDLIEAKEKIVPKRVDDETDIQELKRIRDERN